MIIWARLAFIIAALGALFFALAGWFPWTYGGHPTGAYPALVGTLAVASAVWAVVRPTVRHAAWALVAGIVLVPGGYVTGDWAGVQGVAFMVVAPALLGSLVLWRLARPRAGNRSGGA